VVAAGCVVGAVEVLIRHSDALAGSVILHALTSCSDDKLVIQELRLLGLVVNLALFSLLGHLVLELSRDLEV
jgi:hypothetical protein